MKMVDVLQTAKFRLFVKDMEQGPPLRSLLVREDLGRGYHVTGWREAGHFHPAVSGLTLYIQASGAHTYSCKSSADVLIMREGSLFRFFPTFRGRVFLALLESFVTPSSPWHFKVLPTSTERLSFSQMAQHRAAVFMQKWLAAKMTLKDLLILEIPLFTPGPHMQASISAHNFALPDYGCTLASRIENHSWAGPFCREVKFYPWMNLMPAFRYPHIRHFESLIDLVSQLTAHTCESLSKISFQMRRWNRALLTEDESFWMNAIWALNHWALESAPEAPPEEARKLHHQGTFRLPWKPVRPMSNCSGSNSPVLGLCALEQYFWNSLRRGA